MLEAARDVTLSSRILTQQVQLCSKYARLPNDAVPRRYLFEDTTFNARTWLGPKRRGRPRSGWVKQVYAEALRLADGNVQNLQRMLTSSQAHRR